MTFKEKLRKEHPDKIDDEALGGCIACPHDYGYESYEKRPCIVDDEEGCISCEKCWSRDIPEEEPKLSLNALIERAGTKKDISLTIFITGESTHISVYPCPDPSEKKGNPVAEAYKLLVGSPHNAEAFETAIKKLEEALE